MANETLNQLIAQSLFRMNPQLRGFSVPDLAKSEAWNATQEVDAQLASEAGLPLFYSTPTESGARLRLQDAIARSIASGFNVPHFIGTPNEPTGDRGVTMDIENLVKSLKSREQAAIKARNIPALEKIARERAYWEKEVSEGMSAEEWKSQTGMEDPKY